MTAVCILKIRKVSSLVKSPRSVAQLMLRDCALATSEPELTVQRWGTSAPPGTADPTLDIHHSVGSFFPLFCLEKIQNERLVCFFRVWCTTSVAKTNSP